MMEGMEFQQEILPKQEMNLFPEQLSAEALEAQEYEQTEISGEGIRIEAGEFREDGYYRPGHVVEIDPEAQEFDPEMKELSKELDSWFKQGERTSCAVATQTMALNQLGNRNYSEQSLLKMAKEKGWYHRGTAASDIGKLAEAEGMEVRQCYGRPLKELSIANNPEVKVLANVDSLKMQYPGCSLECHPNHSVQVLRVENTPQGEMVIINDPGHNGGRGEVYPMEVFSRACKGDFTIIRKGS